MRKSTATTCLFAGLLTALPLRPAAAATFRYWLAVGGSYSGDFSDTEHWKGGKLPGSGETGYFSDSVEMSVNIDRDFTFGKWVFGNADLAANPAWVTWTGTNVIATTDTSACYVGKNRRFRINGPYVSVNKNPHLQTNAVLEVASGTLLLKQGEMGMYAGSRLNIKGGLVRMDVGSMGDGAKVCLSGGVWQMSDDGSIASENFEWTGGTRRFVSKQFAATEATKAYLPPRGCALDTRYNSSVNAFYVTQANSTNVIDGTLYITNRLNGTTVSYPRYHVQKVHHRIRGAGTLVVDRFSVRGGYWVTLAVPKVALGTGFYAENSDGAVFSFPNGVAFGSWGDWSNVPDPSVAESDEDRRPSMYLAKDVTFDTRDIFDGTTARTIRLVKCVDRGLTSLKASGGGTVDLVFPSAIGGLRTLEVGADTTLYLTNATVTARRLVLGTNAQLYVPYGSRIEMEAAPGSGAHVHFVGTPAAAALQPCVSAYGISLPSDFVQVDTGVLTTHEWRKFEGVVYLRPRDLVQTIGSADRPYWLGETSSIWSEKTNWTNPVDHTQSILSGSSYGYFGRDVNPYVTNTNSKLSYRYSIFQGSAGPYFIRGEKMDLRYGAAGESSNSIRSGSPFPVVFDAPLSFSSTGPNAYFRNVGKSYVRLNETVSSLQTIWITGDIRFGGDWSCATVSALASDDYTPSLTVLSGGRLTVRETDTPITPLADMRIDGVLNLSNALGSVSSANWWGAGTVKLQALTVPAASAAFKLQDALTLCPEKGWPTAAASAPAVALTIAASGTPTLGATCDWTYGPEAEAEPATTAAERALTVASGTTLAIDTEDPETATGHAITFADPIVGEGSVVKKGAGTLTLATGESRIGGAFSVTGGTIALSGALATAAEGSWTTIFTAASFTGVESALAGSLKVRFVPADGGLTVCQVRTRPGTVFTVR